MFTPTGSVDVWSQWVEDEINARKEDEYQGLNLDNFCQVLRLAYLTPTRHYTEIYIPTSQMTDYMDDDIREQIHAEIAPCSEQDFLDAYEARCRDLGHPTIADVINNNEENKR